MTLQFIQYFHFHFPVPMSLDSTSTWEQRCSWLNKNLNFASHDICKFFSDILLINIRSYFFLQVYNSWMLYAMVYFLSEEDNFCMFLEFSPLARVQVTLLTMETNWCSTTQHPSTALPAHNSKLQWKPHSNSHSNWSFFLFFSIKRGFFLQDMKLLTLRLLCGN